MNYNARVLPTREALARVQQQENLGTDVSGVDLVLNLITTADLIRSNIYDRLAQDYDISEGKFILLMSLYGEGFQFADDALWIGDEFGPYLIKADLNGKVLAVFETQVDGKVVKSPDNPTLTLPGAPDGKQNFQVARSKGFEGMAVSPDGSKLYPMLEGALWNGEKFESIDGKRYLHVLEFDVKNQAWTGRSWQYVLEDNQNAIGDFNMIDAKHGLVIERDNGEGTADRACAAGAATDKCFSQIAKFKRVYKIAFSDENVGKPVEKVSYIDLLNIKDPQNLARKPLNNGVLTFPFFTIENVDVVDANHIIVGNDNNFPLSSSRQPNEADDNEFILLDVKELLSQ